MDVSSMQSLGVDGVKKSKRRKKRSKKQAVEKNGADIRGQMNGLEASDDKGDCRVDSHNLVKDLVSTKLTGKLQGENPNMSANSTENLSKGNAIRRKRKRKKRSKNTKIKDEVQSTHLTQMDAAFTGSLVEGNVTSDRESKQRVVKMAEIEVDVQSVGQTEMGTWSMKNLGEGNMTVKGKRMRKRKSFIKAKIQEEVKNIGQMEMDVSSTTIINKGDVTGKRKWEDESIKESTTVELQSVGKHKMVAEFIHQNKMVTQSVENLCEGTVTSCRRRKRKHKKKASIEKKVQNTSKCETTSNFHLSNEHRLALPTQPLELQRKCCPGDTAHISDPNILGGQSGEFETELIAASNKIILDSGNGSAEQGSVYSDCNVKDAEYLNLKMLSITSIRRKLLILDINGVLADVVKPASKRCRADACIVGQAIFRRPFCDNFLKFCLQNFDVGIWSSRSKKLVHKIVNFLLGDLKEKLLFCWDMSHCTQTGYKTLENRHKPLVCKELRKLWENDDPNLHWKKGDYTESNTLLIDDSPYKALLNPLHTAIFPYSYNYKMKNDNSLGPEGDIRIYLEGLLKSENVQKHVEQHPFGREAIDEQNVYWEFYTGVLNRM